MARPQSRESLGELGAPEPTAAPVATTPEGAPAAASAELLTPAQWGERKGNAVVPTAERPWVEAHFKNFHAEAAQLHGWNAHAYNEQDPAKAFRLSEADYDSALAAASEFPACPAHAAALPPGVKAPPLPKHIEEALAAKAKAQTEGAKPSGA